MDSLGRLTDPIRRLVSGKKARWKSKGYDLDLIYLTDRIIIMGYPASGVESLYRNDRAVVKKWLTERYGNENWWIFNFCPRFENQYPADYFLNHVSRFPFPDHHPPPLALIPLYVYKITKWMDGNDDRVAVIHCKAGKGRSGTMAICYLLSLPSLPIPPRQLSNLSRNSNSTTPSVEKSIDDTKVDARKRAEMLVEGLARQVYDLPEEPAVEGNNEQDQDDTDAVALEALEMADKLAHIFDLHTSQRMAGKGQGVSIPSQKRFISYWSSVLSGQDPRSWMTTGNKIEARRTVKLSWIKVTMPDEMPGLPRLLWKKQISVQISTYRKSILEELEQREIQLNQIREREKRGESNEIDKSTLESWEDDDHWDDEHLMFESLGRFREMDRANRPPSTVEDVEISKEGAQNRPSSPMNVASPPISPASSTTSLSSDSEKSQGRSLKVRTLTPYNKTFNKATSSKESEPTIIEVDSSREVQFKILVGRRGGKHAKLPDVASLGYCWIIPDFHVESTDSNERVTKKNGTFTFYPNDFDFFKKQSGIRKVEIGWEFVLNADSLS